VDRTTDVHPSADTAICASSNVTQFEEGLKIVLLGAKAWLS
jgi:hypothetical protein